MKRGLLAAAVGLLVGLLAVVVVGGVVGGKGDDGVVRQAALPPDDYCASVLELADVDVPGGPLQDLNQVGSDAVASCTAAPTDASLRLTVVTQWIGEVPGTDADQRAEAALTNACSPLLAATEPDGQSCVAEIAPGPDEPAGEFTAFIADDGRAVVSIARTGLPADGSEPPALEPVAEALGADGYVAS